jgi:hypothetical protein
LLDECRSVVGERVAAERLLNQLTSGPKVAKIGSVISPGTAMTSTSKRPTTGIERGGMKLFRLHHVDAVPVGIRRFLHEFKAAL